MDHLKVDVGNLGLLPDRVVSGDEPMRLPRSLVGWLPALLLGLAAPGCLAQAPAGLSSAPGQTVVGGNLPAGAYQVTFRLEIDKAASTVTRLATLGVR
jgi:hypothetical protein